MLSFLIFVVKNSFPSNLKEGFIFVALTASILCQVTFNVIPAFALTAPNIPTFTDVADPQGSLTDLSGNSADDYDYYKNSDIPGSGLPNSLLPFVTGPSSPQSQNQIVGISDLQSYSENYTDFNVIAGASFKAAGGGDAKNNLIWMTGATVGKGDHGGEYKTGSKGMVAGGLSINTGVMGNSVVIKGGEVYGAVVGGQTNAKEGYETSNNIVSIRGGTVDYVYGGINNFAGSCKADLACGGLVQKNNVYVSGGNIYNSIRGGSSVKANIKKNKIIIIGGTFEAIPVNGEARYIDVQAGHSSGEVRLEDIIISENSVELYGGSDGNEIKNYDKLRVFGGYLETGTKGNITNNSVLLYNVGAMT
jgi:hypothetical protein